MGWSMIVPAAFLLCVGVAPGSSQEATFQCPDELPGFFPHDTSCDRYWKCENRVATLLTCGNGLAFDDSDPNYERENCDYLHNVDCGQRTDIEPAISAPNCPRLYGIFADEVNCNTFWSCWSGEANRYECPPGLAYDRSQRVCVWSDQVAECAAEELADAFKCPAEDNGIGTYSLYAHPDDCRLYYVCMNRSPREYGCPIGTVFKIGDLEGTGQCSSPEDVPGCEKYYGDLDMKTLERLNKGGGRVGTTQRGSASVSKQQNSADAPKQKTQLSSASLNSAPIFNRRIQ